MKKLILTLAATFVVGAAYVYAQGPQGNPSNMPGGHWTGCCGPMHGGMMMGSKQGMHRGWMGSEMKGRGWMRGNWMHSGYCQMDSCPWDSLVYAPSGELSESLTVDQAKAMAEHYIAGNQNLKVGKVTERRGSFTVEIVTKKGEVLVDTITIGKTTGIIRPAN